MKLSIGKTSGGGRTLLVGLVTAAFLASVAESLHAAQIINPSSDPTPTANTDPPKSAQLPWIAEVTKMADAGVGPDVMEAYVKSTPSFSTLSVYDLLYLKSHGIDDKVVTAMIQHGANGQQAAAASAAGATPAPQYAPPPQYYAAAPAQSYYPASDYDQGQSSVYVIPQYYPNYYYPYPYYYSYGYPIFYGNFGFGGQRFFGNFDHDRFGRGGFRGGFGSPGFHGGFTGHSGAVGHSAFSPVAPIGFHGGSMGMHGGGGMAMGMGGHGFGR